jgi:hypothetical protein
MKPFEDYEREFIDLTVDDALIILSACESLDENILVLNKTTKFLEVKTVLKACKNIRGDTKAIDISHIQFHGGPPGRYLWVRGSLLTLVMDKIMQSDAADEYKKVVC